MVTHVLFNILERLVDFYTSPSIGILAWLQYPNIRKPKLLSFVILLDKDIERLVWVKKYRQRKNIPRIFHKARDRHKKILLIPQQIRSLNMIMQADFDRNRLAFRMTYFRKRIILYQSHRNSNLVCVALDWLYCDHFYYCSLFKTFWLIQFSFQEDWLFTFVNTILNQTIFFYISYY